LGRCGHCSQYLAAVKMFDVISPPPLVRTLILAPLPPAPSGAEDASPPQPPPRITAPGNIAVHNFSVDERAIEIDTTPCASRIRSLPLLNGNLTLLISLPFCAMVNHSAVVAPVAIAPLIYMNPVHTENKTVSRRNSVREPSCGPCIWRSSAGD